MDDRATELLSAAAPSELDDAAACLRLGYNTPGLEHGYSSLEPFSRAAAAAIADLEAKRAAQRAARGICPSPAPAPAPDSDLPPADECIQ